MWSHANIWMASKSMEQRHLFLLILITIMMFFASTVVQSHTNSTIQNIDDELPLVKFRDISNQSGLGVNIKNWEQHLTDSESFTPGVSWGDYNNDGNLDIFITANFDPSDLNSTSQPYLMHNNGDGTFTDVTEEAGLAYESQSQAGVWGDYDNDGDLDIYISEFGTGFAEHSISIPQEYVDRMQENENA